MTLPQQEIDRIQELYPDNHENPFVNSSRLDKKHAAIEEASVWFKRMGEFAEWVSDNNFELTSGSRWYRIINPRRPESQWQYEYLTTPELIELFINSLSVGFSQHKPQVESVEAGNADKGLDLKKLEEQVDTALAGEDLDR